MTAVKMIKEIVNMVQGMNPDQLLKIYNIISSLVEEHKTKETKMKFRQLIEQDLNEMNSLKMMDAILDAMDKGDSKFDQTLWNFLEDAVADKGIYVADTTPDELLDELSNKQIKELYALLTKKYKNLFEAEITKSMKDIEKDYLKIKKDLDNLWSIIGKDMNTREVDVKVSNEVLSNLNDGIMALDKGFYKFMSKAR